MTEPIEIILVLQENTITVDPLLITATMVGSICTWEILKLWKSIRPKEKKD